MDSRRRAADHQCRWHKAPLTYVEHTLICAVLRCVLVVSVLRCVLARCARRAVRLTRAFSSEALRCLCFRTCSTLREGSALCIPPVGVISIVQARKPPGHREPSRTARTSLVLAPPAPARSCHLHLPPWRIDNTPPLSFPMRRLAVAGWLSQKRLPRAFTQKSS